MSEINSVGMGFYNYYHIEGRYECDKPKEAWYKKDLSKEEIGSNNRGVLNKDSNNAESYRKLEACYLNSATENRLKYSSVDKLKSALWEKYSSVGMYREYSREQRETMFSSELGMTCFGILMGGYVLQDPHLESNIPENKITETREFNQSTLAAQLKNVFNKYGIDTAEMENTKFKFSVDGMTKRLKVLILQENEAKPTDDKLVEKMELALNSGHNARNLFYNMLYDSSRQGLLDEGEKAKYLLHQDFLQNTGLDIREFKKTADGYVNEKGEKARDIFREAVSKGGIVPSEFKDLSYDTFCKEENQAMLYDMSKVADLEMSLQYQSGVVQLATQSSHFDKGA